MLEKLRLFPGKAGNCPTAAQKMKCGEAEVWAISGDLSSQEHQYGKDRGQINLAKEMLDKHYHIKTKDENPP